MEDQKVKEAMLHVKRAMESVEHGASEQALKDLSRAHAAMECFVECGGGRCQREPVPVWEEMGPAYDGR